MPPANGQPGAGVILKWLLLAILFVPLVYVWDVFDGVVFGRILIFTGLVEICTLIFLVRLANGYYRFEFATPDWIILALGAALLVSGFWGTNLLISFWGTLDATLGLFVWVHVFLYLYMLRGVFKRSSNHPDTRPTSLDNNVYHIGIGKIVGLVVVTLIVIYSLVQYHVRPVLAERQMYQAELLARQGNFNQAVHLAESAVRFGTLIRPSIILSFAANTDENVAFYEDIESAVNYLTRSAQWLNDYVIPYRRQDVAPLLVQGGIYGKLISVGRLEYMDDANDAYGKAVQISPRWALTWMEWGKIFLINQEYVKAIEKFDRALELNNTFAEAHLFDAIASLFSGDLKKGNVHLDEVRSLDPGLLQSPVYSGLIVNAYRDNQQSALAVKYLQSVLDIYPATDVIRAQLAVLFKDLGRIQEARTEATYILQYGTDPIVRGTAQKFLDTL